MIVGPRGYDAVASIYMWPYLYIISTRPGTAVAQRRERAPMTLPVWPGHPRSCRLSPAVPDLKAAIRFAFQTDLTASLQGD